MQAVVPLKKSEIRDMLMTALPRPEVCGRGVVTPGPLTQAEQEEIYARAVNDSDQSRRKDVDRLILEVTRLKAVIQAGQSTSS